MTHSPAFDENSLTKAILTSKKYRDLYEPTVRRVVSTILARPGVNDPEKEAKNILHQVWGAFYDTRPDFLKLTHRLASEVQAGGEAREVVAPFLRLHSSTRERMPYLQDFYQKIFSLTGKPETVTDQACGLNPLTYFWMDLPAEATYQAFDIDREEVDFLNSAFGLCHVFDRAQARLGDVFSDPPREADVAFYLKLLPSLEQQEKGVSLRLLRNQPARFLVVSFPRQTIGGSHKNMTAFYEEWFNGLTAAESWRTEKLLFPSELVFVIEK